VLGHTLVTPAKYHAYHNASACVPPGGRLWAPPDTQSPPLRSMLSAHCCSMSLDLDGFGAQQNASMTRLRPSCLFALASMITRTCQSRFSAVLLCPERKLFSSSDSIINSSLRQDIKNSARRSLKEPNIASIDILVTHVAAACTASNSP
jgi:hypothetical protein